MGKVVNNVVSVTLKYFIFCVLELRTVSSCVLIITCSTNSGENEEVPKIQIHVDLLDASITGEHTYLAHRHETSAMLCGTLR